MSLHGMACAELVVKTSGIFGIVRRNLIFCWSTGRSFLVCSSRACHPLSSLEEAMPPPSRPSPRPTAPTAGRWPDVLDVHLTAQLLTVSADTVYDLLQRGDLPGRKVGRKWLTTKTAVLKWLEQSARRARLPRRRRPWRARLPTGIPPHWWTPCIRGKRGSARRSSTPRGQGVSRGFAQFAQFIAYMDLPWFPRTMSCDNSQDHDCTHIYGLLCEDTAPPGLDGFRALPPQQFDDL